MSATVTHDLKLSPAIVGLAHRSVGPQFAQHRRTLAERFRIQRGQVAKLQQLVGVLLQAGVAPLDAQLLAGVHQHLHAAYQILVDDVLVLAHQFRLEVDTVYDAHLLEEGGLARFAGAQQQHFDLGGANRVIVVMIYYLFMYKLCYICWGQEIAKLVFENR